MIHTVDAYAAQLTRLERVTRQKVRSGDITLAQWELFNKLPKTERERRFGDYKGSSSTCSPAISQKFSLVAELGIIKVPDTYVHQDQLKRFSGEYCEKILSCPWAEFTDDHFPNPTRVLMPSDRLRLRVFGQTCRGTTTSDERLTFLASMNAVYAGAQGLSLTYDQKRGKLDKSVWYVSFDKKESLWEDPSGNHRVPRIQKRKRERRVVGYELSLGCFESHWDARSLILCFTQI